MTRALCVACIATIALVGCKPGPGGGGQRTETPTNPAAAPAPSKISIVTQPQGLTLWLTEEVPQVGDIVRISNDGEMARGGVFSNYIADRITPVKGTGFDQSVTITGQGGVDAAFKFLKGIAPSFEGNASHDSHVSLETEQTTALTLPNRTSFLTKLQAMDARPKDDDEGRNVFASLNSQNLAAEGTLYLVTAVHTAAVLTYKSGASNGGSFAAECNAVGQACGKLDFKGQRVVDDTIKATGVPFFVRLKRIGRDPKDGALRYRDDTDGPPAVVGS